MVSRGVDGVGSDDVSAQLLHDRNITSTGSGIGQRISVVITIGGFCEVLVDLLGGRHRQRTLIGDTTHVTVK